MALPSRSGPRCTWPLGLVQRGVGKWREGCGGEERFMRWELGEVGGKKATGWRPRQGQGTKDKGLVAGV